jgi:hypothetical protein
MKRIHHTTAVNIMNGSDEPSDTEVLNWIVELLDANVTTSVEWLSRPWTGDPDWGLAVSVLESDEAALGKWMFDDAQGFIAGQYGERTVLAKN